MFSCFKKRKNIEEKKIVLLVKNDKITNLDTNTENLISKNLKKKYIDELDNINYAINNLSITHTRETKNLENLYLKKNNLNLFLNTVKNTYLEELKKTSELLCCICMDNNINIVFIPCGHVICSKCIIDLQDKESCYKCRQPVKFIQNIYLN